MTWQPIATAPKDGAEFLTCNMRQGGVKRLVSWNIIHGYWQSKGVGIGAHQIGTHWTAIPELPKED